MLLQLSSGVKATGGRAESEGVAHVFDFPTRARCVDVHVIVSDVVKGSHVQRGPLSMGAQSEPGRAISKSKKRRDCAGSLCGRCNSASGLTLGGSVPRPPLALRGGLTTANAPPLGTPDPILTQPHKTRKSRARHMRFDV